MVNLMTSGVRNPETFFGNCCRRCGSRERLVSTKHCRKCNVRWVKQWKQTKRLREQMRGKPCGICEKPMAQPCYDERYGNFRGWVCHPCNLMIGHASDDPEIFRRGYWYLITPTGVASLSQQWVPPLLNPPDRSA